jgi:hypothetical protein
MYKDEEPLERNPLDIVRSLKNASIAADKKNQAMINIFNKPWHFQNPPAPKIPSGHKKRPSIDRKTSYDRNKGSSDNTSLHYRDTENLGTIHGNSSLNTTKFDSSPRMSGNFWRKKTCSRRREKDRTQDIENRYAQNTSQDIDNGQERMREILNEQKALSISMMEKTGRSNNRNHRKRNFNENTEMFDTYNPSKTRTCYHNKGDSFSPEREDVKYPGFAKSQKLWTDSYNENARNLGDGSINTHVNGKKIEFISEMTQDERNLSLNFGGSMQMTIGKYGRELVQRPKALMYRWGKLMDTGTTSCFNAKDGPTPKQLVRIKKQNKDIQSFFQTRKCHLQKKSVYYDFMQADMEERKAECQLDEIVSRSMKCSKDEDDWDYGGQVDGKDIIVRQDQGEENPGDPSYVSRERTLGVYEIQEVLWVKNHFPKKIG